MCYLESQNESSNNQAAISKSTKPFGHTKNASEQEFASQENIMAVDSIVFSTKEKKQDF